MRDKICAIHQPNFFPWLGYFDKTAKVDVFILMDNAQFPKKGGTWCNRVKVMVSGKDDWITMPVDRSYHGVRPIRDIKINDKTPWRAKLLKSIQASYGRTPFFKTVFDLLERLISNKTDSLAEFNIHAVSVMMEILGIDKSKLTIGSSLNASGNATDLLISMVKAAGCDAYMCGGGADGYQEDSKFAAAGIKLIYQNFQHPVYNQMRNGFIPGLSVIDALFHVGPQMCGGLLSPERVS